MNPVSAVHTPPRINRKWRYDHEAPHQQRVALPGGRSSGPSRLAAEPDPGLGSPVSAQTGGQPGFRSGNDELRRIALHYIATHGRNFGVQHYQVTPRQMLNPQLSMATADAFERMQHDPQNPAVKAAYDALIKETIAQYNHLTENGYKMEPWVKPGQPYANSKEMARDVAGKHIWYFPTVSPIDQATFGEGTGDLDPNNNPLVAKTGHNVNGMELRANDLFRAVHDIYGHALEGHEFGPAGEYNAWNEHAKLFSPLAQRALTTETHGQNSWVNFGRHLRRVDGSIPAKGDPDWVHPAARPFAEQKVNILPPEVHPPHPYTVEKKTMLQRLGEKIRFGRDNVPAKDAPLFHGDLHGFILYPSTRIKSDDAPWEPLRESFDKQFTEEEGQPPSDHGQPLSHMTKSNLKPSRALQFELPRTFTGLNLASSYQRPDPLRHDLAASMLFRENHAHFLTHADQAARNYLHLRSRLPTPEDYQHVHGIGSWENLVEPSMATVFRRPVTAEQLKNIAADVGSWARQHAVLAFSPHPEGTEQMLHMRVRTHERGKVLSPQAVAEAAARVHDEFNKYFRTQRHQGASKEFLMPGRSILPDTTGHSDVLVWVPPWEQDPHTVRQAFGKIASDLGTRAKIDFGTDEEPIPRYWSGTGIMLGGTSPYSDEETSHWSDWRKRNVARLNYEAAARETTDVPDPVPTEPRRFAARGEPVRLGRWMYVFRKAFQLPPKQQPPTESYYQPPTASYYQPSKPPTVENYSNPEPPAPTVASHGTYGVQGTNLAASPAMPNGTYPLATPKPPLPQALPVARHAPAAVPPPLPVQGLRIAQHAPAAVPPPLSVQQPVAKSQPYTPPKLPPMKPGAVRVNRHPAQYSREPVRFAGGVPTTPEELRAISHGWLENPQDMSYPTQIIPDMLQEMDHPAHSAWDWYWNKGLPAVRGVEYPKANNVQERARAMRDSGIAENEFLKHFPETGSLYENAGGGLVGPALMRALSLPRFRGNLLAAFDKQMPDFAKKVHQVIASGELTNMGVLPIREVQAGTPGLFAGLTPKLADTLNRVYNVSSAFKNSPYYNMARLDHIVNNGTRDAYHDREVTDHGYAAGPTVPASKGGPIGEATREKNSMAINRGAAAFMDSGAKHFKPENYDIEADFPLPPPPLHFDRAPAGTGMVVRGVFYPPGKMIPKLETLPGAPQPPKPPAPVQPAKISVPQPTQPTQPAKLPGQWMGRAIKAMRKRPMMPSMSTVS